MQFQSSDFYFGFSLVGVIFGQGAALVILFLGVMSLRKHYWFHILNGADKITIPMLWFGGLNLLIATWFASQSAALAIDNNFRILALVILLINGSYLTFIFAPVIRKLENDGKTTFLKLPMPHQILIFIAGTIAALSWTSHAVMLWLEIVSLT
jgi:uncharacterized membrane protein